MVAPSLSWREKFGVSGLLVLLLGVVYYLPLITEPLGTYRTLFVVVLFLMQVGITVGSLLRPYTRFVGENVRLTEEPERTDYARCCREWGTPLRGVWTVDDLQNNYEFAEIYGLVPGNRHLFVETTFFELYSPEERTAVVATAAALADSYYELFAKTLVYLVFLVYYAAVLVVIYATGSRSLFQGWSFVPALLLVGGLVLAILWGRHLVYEADRFAAEQTDVETVVAALRKFAGEKGESDAESTRIRLLSLLWTRPSPSKRIERLRERSE
jgi:Zn-dependent protease with chaperone function